MGRRRLKIIFYLFSKNKNTIFKIFFKNPLKYTYFFIKSFFKIPYIKEDDLYLFNIKSLEEAKNNILDKTNILYLAFSYCQKHEKCPIKFSSKCIKKFDVCKSCFFYNLKNKNFSIITTTKELGQKLLELYKHKNSFSKIFFIISACPFAIENFSKIANILNLKGIALSLEGNVCTNFKAFALAEKGLLTKTTFLKGKKVFEVLKIADKRFF